MIIDFMMISFMKTDYRLNTHSISMQRILCCLFVELIIHTSILLIISYFLFFFIFFFVLFVHQKYILLCNINSSKLYKICLHSFAMTKCTDNYNC